MLVQTKLEVSIIIRSLDVLAWSQTVSLNLFPVIHVLMSLMGIVHALKLPVNSGLPSQASPCLLHTCSSLGNQRAV